MVIFKYELLQIKNYIFTWSVILFLLIIGMLPTYMGFMIGGTISVDALSDNPFFLAIGINLKSIGTPIGVYGFLTSFVIIAGAINGMHMGLKVFTKEYMQRTADYIMTKPYSRTSIYFAKLSAMISGAFLISCAYGIGSFLSILLNVKEAIDTKAFLFLLLSFFLIQLIFLVFGVFIGTIFTRIRTPLSVSAGTAFVAYVIGVYSRKVNNPFTKFLSPYVYFNNSHIIESGGYELKYMIAMIVFLVAFTLISYIIFKKKDIVLVS